MHQVVRERQLNIELPDGKQALGWLREIPDAPVVVMGHGLTSGIFEHPLDFAARELSKHGYSTYRFAFYAYGANTRSTTYMTIDDHTNDIDAVVRHFKSSLPKVSVVAHSIAGLAALASRDQAFDSLTVWDGSHPRVLNPSNWPDLWHEEPGLECWRLSNGVVSLIDKRFVDSFVAVDIESHARTMSKPTKLIAASESVNFAHATEIHQLLGSEHKALHIVEGADHDFMADEHANELIEETVAWLNSYGR